MNFVKLNETTDSIASIAMCNKKKIVAVCEK